MCNIYILQYGGAQSHYLPYKNFHWKENVEEFEKMIKDGLYKTWTGKENTGYILEVDLSYPEELHEKHSSVSEQTAKSNIFLPFIIFT